MSNIKIHLDIISNTGGPFTNIDHQKNEDMDK